MTMKSTKSADGTAIAFEITGQGTPLILVGGAFCDRTARTSGTPLAALLADRFTVLSYDRRGRGDSGDAIPYAVEREREDIAALIDVLGGSSHVFGNSSGALLALDAAADGLSLAKLVLYEPPVILDVTMAAAFAALAPELEQAAASDQRARAVELYFTKVMQMPAAALAPIRASPMWSGLESLAHTLAYDLRITALGASRLARSSTVRAATLVIEGGASPPWMRDALVELTSALPHASLQTLQGQTHAVDPAVLAEAIGAFLVG